MASLAALTGVLAVPGGTTLGLTFHARFATAEAVTARLHPWLNLDGVDDVAADLFESARAVQANAHVPYSELRRRCGGAHRVRTHLRRRNVENAAYPRASAPRRRRSARWSRQASGRSSRS